MKEFLALIEKYKTVNKEADEILNKRKQTVSELERAERNLAKARADDAVEVQKVRLQTQELNKANKEAAREANNMVTAYQKFAKEVNQAKTRAKILGAEMIDLENRFKRGEVSSKQYNQQINKLSKEYTEARLKAMGLDSQLKKLDSSVGDSQRNVGNYKSAIGGIGNAFKGAMAAFGVVSAMDMFADLTRQSFETVKVLNAQNAALKQVFETEAQVAAQKEYLTNITQKYGLELVSTTDAYARFAAAIKGTYLEGEKGQEIFTSFAAASTKLGLSVDEQEGIFRALGQMISKGKIQAEELRGQLGDRMSGAFALFASSIGVTTSQLDEMLKSGEVIADEVLPKVAERLGQVYDLNAEADTLVAAQNRLKNEWTGFLDSIAGNKELINGLADGMEVLGDVLEFVLDVLIVRGDDGVSIVGDLVDIIGSLFSALGEIAEGLGLVTEEQQKNLFSMKQFKADLIAIESVINVLAGGIKYLAETITNFFATMTMENGWDEFVNRMEKSADRFLGIIGKYNDAQNEAKILTGQLGEGDAYLLNEKRKTEEYQKAWAAARKEKQAFFQVEGKYYNSATGRNTGKTVDNYIDRNGELVAKETYAMNTGPGGNSATKKASDKARKDAEREAKRQQKLALENAKAEIEARKIVLDFMLKSFEEEKKLNEEKVNFYAVYYEERRKIMDAERALELQTAETAGERKKIIEKYKLEELVLEQQHQEKLKQIRIQAADSEKAFYEANNASILALGIQLTDALIENEKNRLDRLTELSLQSLSEKYELDEETVNQKILNNEQLTDAEKNFYAESTKLHKENADAKREIDTEYFEQYRQNFEQMLNIERLKRGEFYDTDFAMQTDHEKRIYEEEQSALSASHQAKLDLIQKNITDVEARNEAIAAADEEYRRNSEEAELQHQENLNNIRREGFAYAIGLQQDFVDNLAEINQIRSAADKLMTAKTTEDFMGGLAQMADGVKSFAKEGSATWKALAVFQATLNMYVGISAALKEDVSMIKKFINIALITATGMRALASIRSTPNPRYEEGTLFAERSTMATVDEKGPELHFDKNWRLKDRGQSGGPRSKFVTQGDKILPAEISKMIMSIKAPQIIDKTERIDYDLLAQKIAEKTAKENGKIKKEFHLFDNITGDIIRIESKNGVRTVYRKQPIKPTGQNLQ